MSQAISPTNNRKVAETVSTAFGRKGPQPLQRSRSDQRSEGQRSEEENSSSIAWPDVAQIELRVTAKQDGRLRMRTVSFPVAQSRAVRRCRQLFSHSTRAPRVMEKMAGAGCRVTARCTAGHAATHSVAVSPADRLPEVSAKR